MESVPDTQSFRDRVDQMRMRAEDSWARYINSKCEVLQRTEAQLRALGPYNILERGYVMARTPDGVVVSKAADVSPDQLLELTFANGTVETETRSIHLRN